MNARDGRQLDVSLILQTATRFLMPLLLLFSLFLLFRGHQKPGGGFIGGLVAAAAFSLYAIAYNTKAARAVLRIEPHVLIGAGLLLALFSATISLFGGAAFMTGRWTELSIPGIGTLSIGTPVIFDIGVYIVVIGVALIDVFSLAEESED